MNTAHPVEQEPRYAWIVVWASFTALAVIFGVAYSFAAFFESFATAFGASRAEVSLVFGLSGLLYFVLGAVGGMLSDRYGPRRVTSAGMLCIAAALGLGSMATSITQLILVSVQDEPINPRPVGQTPESLSVSSEPG